MIEITPQLIDLILVGVLVEFAVLAALLARAGAAAWIAPLFLFLASGALLFIALRAALAGDVGVIGPVTGLAGLAHVAFLVMAYRQAGRWRKE